MGSLHSMPPSNQVGVARDGWRLRLRILPIYPRAVPGRAPSRDADLSGADRPLSGCAMVRSRDRIAQSRLPAGSYARRADTHISGNPRDCNDVRGVRIVTGVGIKLGRRAATNPQNDRGLSLRVRLGRANHQPLFVLLFRAWSFGRHGLADRSILGGLTQFCSADERQCARRAGRDPNAREHLFRQSLRA